ncbi:hypothetical protein CCMA1212_000075 [Trichoderma ghanense]|uniref:Uncharacterized protein n=1 Tax=Trichoderma ghanense TaxID=65468 RepID=A0ABY2HF02_9HYPO
MNIATQPETKDGKGKPDSKKIEKKNKKSNAPSDHLFTADVLLRALVSHGYFFAGTNSSGDDRRGFPSTNPGLGAVSESSSPGCAISRKSRACWGSPPNIHRRSSRLRHSQVGRSLLASGAALQQSGAAILSARHAATVDGDGELEHRAYRLTNTKTMLLSLLQEDEEELEA